jgi:hypothetical protein
MAGSEHWNERYRSVGATAVSWYESTPTVSLELFARLGVTTAQSVIDVGGGASVLVDQLLERGHQEVAVLDLSKVALDEARARLADDGAVTWIEADLLHWDPPRRWDVWHDRAVLHFLVSDDDRATYVEVLRRAVGMGGAFVIGTFAEDGPMECSSLPVRRQSADELIELLGDVEVIDRGRHVHHTPGGVDQPFTWVAGRLR